METKFAIVELKYEEKKTFIVRLKWIKAMKPKPSAVDLHFCYISTDLTAEPNFGAKYLKTFDGESGYFKVFIRKITG